MMVLDHSVFDKLSLVGRNVGADQFSRLTRSQLRLGLQGGKTRNDVRLHASTSVQTLIPESHAVLMRIMYRFDDALMKHACSEEVITLSVYLESGCSDFIS
jgi:hypothetical protein